MMTVMIVIIKVPIIRVIIIRMIMRKLVCTEMTLEDENEIVMEIMNRDTQEQTEDNNGNKYGTRAK